MIVVQCDTSQVRLKRLVAYVFRFDLLTLYWSTDTIFLLIINGFLVIVTCGGVP